MEKNEIAKSILDNIVSTKPITAVYPREFFISWNGVPTLAFQGFSQTLLDIKREIECDELELKIENNGSKWPKTTLGAIQDGLFLKYEDLKILRNICDNINKTIDKEKYFEIDELSVVLFQRRSLEKRLITHSIKLDKTQERDINYPPSYHLDYVNNTIKQFSRENLENYYMNAKQYGNRNSHYRAPHIEPTLVFDLPSPNQQPPYIQEFINEVDEALPNLYCWFLPESRHMTVRALTQ